MTSLRNSIHEAFSWARKALSSQPARGRRGEAGAGLPGALLFGPDPGHRRGLGSGGGRLGFRLLRDLVCCALARAAG